MRRVTSFTIVALTIAMLAAMAPGATAIAIGPGTFVIPAGSTASFTNAERIACNSLTWGFQLNGGANQPQFTFPNVCATSSAPDVTIGPFAAPVTLLVFMTDNNCDFTYYSDGTPVDHVVVDGSNPYSLRFADAGILCERRTITTNDFPDFNFRVDLAISGDQAITASGQSVNATEGAPFSGQVATFTDPNNAAVATDYSATIVWGDGHSSAGTIGGSGGNFTVSGVNTYAEEGTYNVTVTITDVDTAITTATANSATVLDAALKASPACSATSLQAYNGATAMFTDAASPSGTLTDFSASINWGDGTVTAGSVGGADGGPYTVSGSHTYATTGTFTITTTITDVGGSTATTSCHTLGFSFAPGGGSFVIGDKNAAVGSSVTFWGGQWAKVNSLSGGATPRDFKGFAEDPTTPACGAGWTADPGDSTPPPDGPLPTFMAVIVTSSADQSGSTTSGDTVHIVIVKTNPGYAPNAGHAGTGTVVAVVC